MPFRILPSTTSHKREPLVSTLEVFAKLGLLDIDLNLHHLFELGTPVRMVKDALAANEQRVWIVSGGWCDFFHTAPEIDGTMEAVATQVALAHELGVNRMRLFYGRLAREKYTADARRAITE